MKLLSTLILMHCFSCMFLKKFGNEIKFRKLILLKSKENILTYNSHVLISNIIHKCNLEKSLLPIEVHRAQRNETNIKKEINLCSFPLNNNKCTQYSCPRPLHYINSLNYQRKLLSYSDNTPYANSIKSEQSQDTQKANTHQNLQNYLLRDVKNQNELWDEWGNWSTCSVTCGNGRQVRWRHCSAEDCTKGLKKAQIKACHLKNCDSKTILHWLGIKTR